MEVERTEGKKTEAEKTEGKKMQTEHGVQIGDIFCQRASYEDFDSCSFYQVVSLRGKTQVAVRKIKEAVIAFDHFHEGVVPVKDSWVNDEILFRKVGYRYDGERYITVESGWQGNAYLDVGEMHILSGRSPFAETLCEYRPDIAEQLDLKQGSGVFSIDKPFDSIADNCRAVVRYPNGDQQEVILSELLCWEEVLRHRKQ